MGAELTRAQTTLEYLLILSVVILLLIGLFLTIRQLRESSQVKVTVGNQTQSPIQAINETLQEMSNFTTGNQTT